MDRLAIVAERARKLEEIAELYDAALLARNESICDARDDRHGPTAIAAAADLNVESVRRIYNAPRGKLTHAASRARKSKRKAS